MDHRSHMPGGVKCGLSGDSGQTLVEYSLILLLIAVVVVMILRGFGQTTNKTYTTINSAVTSAVGS